MNSLVVSIMGLTCVFLMCCSQGPEQSVEEAFQKVDGSLQTSNKELNDSLLKLYNSIRENKADITIADSIVHYYTEATSYIDSIQNILKLIGDLGDNRDDRKIVIQMFIRSDTGEVLKSRLIRLYKTVYSVLDNVTDKENFQKNFREINSATRMNNWQEIYFGDTPVVAAITILAKFKNDCIKMTGIALSVLELQKS